MAVEQQVVIVTGAGGGMGQAILKHLLEQGKIVVGLDLSVASLADRESDVLQLHDVNVLHEDKVNEVFQNIYDKYGRIDGLVNAIGIAQAATPIEDVSINEWNRLMDVNVKSLFITTKAAVPYMKARKKGAIVTIASISAVRPRPGLQAYIASKGAAESFSRGLAIELAPHQIRVNTIHPGPADTQMLSQFAASNEDVEQTKQEVFVQSVPLGRLVDPTDIAGAVCYLLSDAASMVTGTTLHVDGGPWIVMQKIPMLINGNWVYADEERFLDVMNPSTGEVLAQISNANEAQVNEAIRAARVAFDSEEWRKVKAFERGQLLIELAQYIREHAEEWSLLECRDVGKPLSQARADIEAAARYFEFYGGAADKVMGDTIPIEDGILNAVVLEPVGITVHIVPWNYPIQITARSVAAAIATGNAVIVKSAEDTPLTTHAITKWFADKVPAGIFQHVTGLGSDVGPLLTSHPDINHITFTGSVSTGIAVMQAAAKNIVPVTLELGGKSPNIVFADAPMEQALDGVLRAIIQNAGQTCSAGARLLIEESAKEVFLTQLVERFKVLKVGPGEADLDMGPLLNKRQFMNISGRLQQAREDGYVVVGGETLTIEGYGKGYYVQPTILDGMEDTHVLAQEEIFGPVLTVFSFDTVEKAIALANSTQYGLVAGVWSKDLDTAHYVASRVQAGQVFINNYGAAGGIQMPFGGYKKSGIGREKGFVALRNYTQMKNIAIRYALPN